jgi:TolB-like protein/Tfp pilus assembly protein PilF
MSEQPPSWEAFLAELKRRRVFRVMAVYGAVAFVVLQVADLAFPRLGLPEWTVTLTLVLAMLGFPLAIVLAWAFETTPQGVRRTVAASPEEIREIVEQPPSRRWIPGLLALIGIGLLFATGWWIGAGRHGNGPAIRLPEMAASEVRTLAVLPFENVNGNDDNRIMALGLHDDLVSQLARISGLRVTSRTSVREYGDDTRKSLREIAGDLGVQYVLEGAVRSSADRIRVSVTLVDAATDEPLRSLQYDREEVTPESLFDIQSDIALRVAGELEAQLTPPEVAALNAIEPASNIAAQTWYYRGLDLFDVGGSDVVEAARDALLRAVELDPEFVAAWTALTRVESFLVYLGRAEPEKARRAMERTVAIAPGTVEADLVRGYFAYYAQRDYGAALEAFRAAEGAAPSHAEAAWALGLILRRQGQWEESTVMLGRAVRLDPRNYERFEPLFENLAYIGAYRDADLVIEHALAVDPESSKARSWKVFSLAESAGTGPARRLAGELGLDPADVGEADVLVSLAVLDGDYPRALEIADGIETGGSPALEFARLNMKGTALRLMDDPSAVAVADSLLALVPPGALQGAELPAVRGFAHALAGRREAAIPELREATRLVRRWTDHVLDPRTAATIVTAYGMIDEIDAGIDLLEEIVDRPNDYLTATIMRSGGFYAAYRDDPRLAGLIERRERFEEAGAAWAASHRPWVP